MSQNNNFLFEKEFLFGDTTYYIVFKGIEKNKIRNFSILCNRIDDELKQIDLCDSLPEKIYLIRSIFKDFNENYLNFSVSDDGNLYTVIYVNKELRLYELEQKKSDKCGSYHVVYDEDKGIQVSGDLMKDIQHSVSMTSDFMKEIYYLKHVIPIVLDGDSKLLCQIYQLFYDECVQFHDPDIRVKIQFMMFLLSEFGISLGEKYSFSMYSKGFPCSIELSDLINRLKPYQIIEHIDDPIEIAKEAKKTIQVIGGCVREFVREQKDVASTLVHISSVLYARDYRLNFGASVDDISKYLNYSNSEVQDSIQFVKKIHLDLRKCDN